MRLRRRVALVGVLVVLGALLTGCGDDGGSAEASDREDSSTSTSTSTETTARDQGGSNPETGGDVVPSRALPSAGDATAAQGSELVEAPGPADRRQLDGFDEVAIAVREADGQVVGWCTLLAETDEQHQRGLMEVTDLGGYAGMLFVWEEDIQAQFYMRNTPMPLSIAWFDASGELVSTEDMPPCADADACPLYSATGPYRFALEVPQGQLADLGVEEGSVIRVGGDCAARSP